MPLNFIISIIIVRWKNNGKSKENKQIDSIPQSNSCYEQPLETVKTPEHAPQLEQTNQSIKKDVTKPKRACYDPNGQPVKKRNKIEKKPSNEVRYDKIEHFPEMQDCVPVRCKREDCHFKSRVFCIKCKVHLCLIQGRNCFKDFHYTGKENLF